MNVIDFFTRRRITRAPSKEEVEGVYIGNIHPATAEMVRLAKSAVEAKEKELERVEEEWKELSYDYAEQLSHVLTILDSNEEIDLRTHDLSISEEGHIWLVKR